MLKWIALLMCSFLVVVAAANPAEGLRSPKELVNAAKAEIVEISVADAASRIEKSTVLVDVREPGEFAQGHLPGAVNIPRGRIEFDILDHPLLAKLNAEDDTAAADAEILVYCRTGGRAALSAQSLQSLGFTQVRSISGGYVAWKEAGEDVVRSDLSKSTD